MKVSLIVFVTIFLCFLTQPCAGKKDVLMQAVFWEVKPYIYTDKSGELKGIIPMIFKRAQFYCFRNQNESLIDYSGKLSSRREFYELLSSREEVYGKGNLKYVNKSKAIWLPLTSTVDGEWAMDNGYIYFMMMKTNEIAVIVPRHQIDLPNKIIRGIMSCKPIFIIASLLVVVFSVTIWFIEKTWNEDFSPSFIKGCGTGFWWSVVSMTTVGYGDIVPRSPLGRFIAFFWLIIGVMIGCVMTATMTEVVSGVGDLSVYGKTVAVIENSYEEKVASLDHHANVVTAKSYEEVLDLVRENKVFAAMVNADIAAWYQDEINDESKGTPLHIIEKLPANLNLNVVMSIKIPNKAKKALNCMNRQKDEVYTYPIQYYQRYCHTETTYIGSLYDLISYNVFVQFLISMAGFLIIIGVFYDLYVYFIRERKGGQFHKDFARCLKGLLGHKDNEEQELEEKVRLMNGRIEEKSREANIQL